jgi:hypothetical protein
MQRLLLRQANRVFSGPMFRPGLVRAIGGLILGTIITVIVISILRFVLSIIGFMPADTNPLPSSGALLTLCGIGGAAGWLWGMGAFNPHSHEHEGLEHAYAHAGEEPGRAVTLLGKGMEVTPGIVRMIIPLIRPLLFTLLVSMAVVALFLVLGSTPVARVQTDKPEANAASPAGSVYLPIGPDGTPVSKLIFFIILSVAVLGNLAILAIVIALIFIALNRGVNEAKLAPANPPTEEPKLFKLASFFMTWIDDILASLKRSVVR